MSSLDMHLERSFRSLVIALDALPEAESRDFLARLALILADEIKDGDRFQNAVDRAAACAQSRPQP